MDEKALNNQTMFLNKFQRAEDYNGFQVKIIERKPNKNKEKPRASLTIVQGDQEFENDSVSNEEPFFKEKEDFSMNYDLDTKYETLLKRASFSYRILTDMFNDNLIGKNEQSVLLSMINELIEAVQILLNQKSTNELSHFEEVGKSKDSSVKSGETGDGKAHKSSKFSKEGQKNILKETIGEPNSSKNSILFLKNKIKTLKRSVTLERCKHNKMWTSCNELITYQKSKINDLNTKLNQKTNNLLKIRKSLKKGSASNAGRMTTIQHLKDLLKKTAVDLERYRIRECNLQDYCKKFNLDSKEKTMQMSFLKKKIDKLSEISEEMERNYEKQMEILNEENESLKTALGKSDEHLICRVQTKNKINVIKQLLTENMTVATEKLTKADNKIKELFLTLELLMKRLHRKMYGKELEKANNICKEELSSVNEVCSILKVDPGEISKVLTAGKIPQVREWMKKCKQFVYREKFADDLVSYMMSLFRIMKP